MNSKYKKITIGGLSGTGKGTISKMLAERLGFSKISAGDFLREIAKERNMSIVEMDRFMYDNPKEGEELDRMIDKRTEDYGKGNENFIAEGRLTAHFIKDAFKILLLCDERRFERIAGRDSVPIEKAKEDTLHREDSYHKRYGQFYDLADFDDAKYYDLVIDTSNLIPDEIVEKIINQIT